MKKRTPEISQRRVERPDYTSVLYQIKSSIARFFGPNLCQVRMRRDQAEETSRCYGRIVGDGSCGWIDAGVELE